MKRGFTLVELLAVIVILAVIALITIPAVMKMIDNATINSYRRSIDLYGKAVSQGVISYESDMVETGKGINVTFNNIEPYIEYEGNDVDCKDKTIYSDRTILITQCYVQEELVYAEKGRGYGEENYYYYTNSKKKAKLIKYMEAVKEAIQGKNINGTCQAQEDKITCNGQDINIKSKLENAIEGSLVIENNKVKSYSNLKFATEKKIETNNEVPQVIDEQNTSNENSNETLATEEDYRGYYADVDGDGEVDGVIYADLKQTVSGQWKNSNGAYTYTAKTNLNEYTISKNKHNGNFGEKEIIKLKKDKDNPRFYVMALEDFRTGSFEAVSRYKEGTYHWYKNASRKMNASDTSKDFGKGYDNTGKIIEIWNEGESGKYTAAQDNQDIFKHIQEKYNSKEKWYIPSRGEWAAFADYFANKTDLNPKLTTNNYNTLYGLSGWYWSSSQGDELIAWSTFFYHGFMFYDDVGSNEYVRLGATF